MVKALNLLSKIRFLAKIQSLGPDGAGACEYTGSTSKSQK